MDDSTIIRALGSADTPCTVRDQLPEQLQDRLAVFISTDLFSRSRHNLIAHFVVRGNNEREFTCEIDDNFQVPAEFIAHLCAVV